MVTEKNEILSFVSKQKDDMLSKISEDQKKILIILSTCAILKYFTHKREQDEGDWTLEVGHRGDDGHRWKAVLDRRSAFW